MADLKASADANAKSDAAAQLGKVFAGLDLKSVITNLTAFHEAVRQVDFSGSAQALKDQFDKSIVPSFVNTINALLEIASAQVSSNAILQRLSANKVELIAVVCAICFHRKSLDKSKLQLPQVAKQPGAPQARASVEHKQGYYENLTIIAKASALYNDYLAVCVEVLSEKTAASMATLCLYFSQALNFADKIEKRYGGVSPTWPQTIVGNMYNTFRKEVEAKAEAEAKAKAKAKVEAEAKAKAKAEEEKKDSNSIGLT